MAQNAPLPSTEGWIEVTARKKPRKVLKTGVTPVKRLSQQIETKSKNGWGDPKARRRPYSSNEPLGRRQAPPARQKSMQPVLGVKPIGVHGQKRPLLGEKNLAANTNSTGLLQDRPAVTGGGPLLILDVMNIEHGRIGRKRCNLLPGRGRNSFADRDDAKMVFPKSQEGYVSRVMQIL